MSTTDEPELPLEEEGNDKEHGDTTPETEDE